MNRKPRKINHLLAAGLVAVVSAGVSACAAGMQGSASVGAEAHANMTAVHLAEIQESQLALSKTSNAEVRAFAQHMVSDHRPLLQEEQQLATQLGLRAEAGVQVAGIGAELGVNANSEAMMMAFPTSRTLVEQHMRAMADLRNDSGAEFDRAYMDRQVASHQQSLELATRFEASVQNAQQRALIARERAAIQAHLQHAQQVRAALR